MISGLGRRPDAFVSFGFAFGAATALMLGAHSVAPHGDLAPVALGGAFVAAIGIAWALLQAFDQRRHARRLEGWIAAAAGATLIVVHAAVASSGALANWGLLEVALSATISIAAASLMFICCRRYAMRRYVMATMQAGFLASVLTVGLDAISHAGAGAEALRSIRETTAFASVALFVAALLFTRFAPLKVYAFGPVDIGRRARRLFYDFELETRARYPTPYAILGVPGVRHVFIIAMIAWFAPRAASAAALSGGRSPIRQVWDMLRLGFGEHIDAKSYYVHDLYRADRPSAVDETLTRVETKNGLTSKLQNLDHDPTLVRELNDKLEFWRICERAGVPSAPILAAFETGGMEPFFARAAFDRDLFVKERRGRGGCFTLNFIRVEPLRYRNDAGDVLALDEVLDALRAHSTTRRLILQPKLANHPAIAAMADQALIVFRVVTCLDHHGDPQVTHGVLRLLRRFEPNWPQTPDADWGCAIDLETGRLGMMTGDAPATCTKWFSHHPVTQEKIEGRVLEGWPEIAETARAGHRTFPGRTLIGWDMGWTPEGACILEGNTNMDFSYFQRVYRTPVGRSPLAPLLNARLSALAEQLVERSVA